MIERASAGPRRFPVGAEPIDDYRTSFRVWAPRCRSVGVVIGGSETVGPRAEAGPHAHIEALFSEPDGYWSGVMPCLPGDRYRFLLDERFFYPDPASRFQPLGPHGPSQVVDPTSFPWRDGAWRGLSGQAQHVMYETHVGTFTPEGTWRAATAELDRLAEIGITCLEMLPVADFHGHFGWGYDGVNLFAPTRLYGEPDDLRRLVDRAHELGIAVILDVVYNHLGLEGNYLGAFSDSYASERYASEWGPSLNFDGRDCGPVREFVRTNAQYWLEEFHMDGFRLDATQAIRDSSPVHMVTEIVAASRAATDRDVLIVAENEPQDRIALDDAPDGGWGLDGLWNDDFHHAAYVGLTGHAGAYYSGYRGSPQEFVSLAKHSFLYQGQYYRWQGKRRGTSTAGLERWRFVNYLENHDQVANSLHGTRLHRLAGPGRYRALTALLLLLPQTPLLFQGQEFGSSSPFRYFADAGSESAAAVLEGRTRFMRQFPSVEEALLTTSLADPTDETTFQEAKLESAERRREGPLYELHRDLIALRKSDPIFSRSTPSQVDGAVVGGTAFVVRFLAGGNSIVFSLSTLAPIWSRTPLRSPWWRRRRGCPGPNYGRATALPTGVRAHVRCGRPRVGSFPGSRLWPSPRGKQRAVASNEARTMPIATDWAPIVVSLDVSAWRMSRTPELLEHEWLVTNGLGGYASSSIIGAPTRRYHGLLVAALPAPWGRIMSLTHIEEVVIPG